MEPRLAEMLARLEGEDSVSYKPFGEPAELRDLLLDDLAVLLTERFEAIPATPSPNGQRRICRPHVDVSRTRGRAGRVGHCSATTAVRLVTLIGPGGTGKTRLAVEAARAQVGRFEDGVFFVDLSAEREPDEVFAAIARTLGMSGETEGSAWRRSARICGSATYCSCSTTSSR